MSCISNLLFTCIPCLCDIKFYKKIKNKKWHNKIESKVDGPGCSQG